MLSERTILNIRTLALPAVLTLLLFLGPASGQNRSSGRTRFGGRYERFSPEALREQEEMKAAIQPGFEEDVFTFARLRFEAERGWGFGGGRLWDDDSPEADLNLTYRLYQVTSFRVRPGLNVIDITTNDLQKYPFVYIAAAGRLVLSRPEGDELRRYLLNGGFLMVDDFWGDEQWGHFCEQFKRVFPDREPVELALDHPIFHNIYDFKKEPQMPSVGVFFRYGVSYEPNWPYYIKSHEPHYYGIFGDDKRLMAIICHNNHYGDGWEHESDDQRYFDAFSEPMAYPMFINILTYAMTH